MLDGFVFWKLSFLKRIKKRNAFFADTNTGRDFLTEMEERKKQKVQELKELGIIKGGNRNDDSKTKDKD